MAAFGRYSLDDHLNDLFTLITPVRTIKFCQSTASDGNRNHEWFNDFDKRKKPAST
jgi:hypothetical protein